MILRIFETLMRIGALAVLFLLILRGHLFAAIIYVGMWLLITRLTDKPMMTDTQKLEMLRGKLRELAAKWQTTEILCDDPQYGQGYDTACHGAADTLTDLLADTAIPE